MKTIITLLLCISIVSAQQVPNTLTSREKNKFERQTVIAKWRERMKQLNISELRKLQVDTLQQHKSSLMIASAKVSVDAVSYDVPIASKGNTIELAVANTSVLAAEGVKVEVTNNPEWLKFTKKDMTLTTLKANEEQTASFTFSVDKSAKVNKQDTLHFTITDKTGRQWTKDIAIKIAPPATYELYQNYPNPFNPTTVISYQLSAISNVNLKIYDAIGREVANLVNEQQDAGYYQKTFDASRYTSGMYVYRLIATDEQNNHHVFQKKMLMVK